MALGYSASSSQANTTSAAALSGFGGQTFRFGGVNFGTKTRNVGAAAGLGSVAGATSPLLVFGGAALLLVGVLWIARRK